MIVSARRTVQKRPAVNHSQIGTRTLTLARTSCENRTEWRVYAWTEL